MEAILSVANLAGKLKVFLKSGGYIFSSLRCFPHNFSQKIEYFEKVV